MIREFTLKRLIFVCRGLAQSGSAPALGAGCRGFESLLPDHFFRPHRHGRSLGQGPISGGCSSPGRAPDCGSGGSGFETHQPPHFLLLYLCVAAGGCVLLDILHVPVITN